MADRSPLPPRVWVLPNRRTPGLVAVVVAMWYAGASQGNGAAYLLCFVITALSLVSIIHGWNNLRGIALDAGSVPPVFAGEELSAPIEAKSVARRAHFALRIAGSSGKHPSAIAVLEPGQSQRAEVRIEAARRGYFRELRVRLSSCYPLGFFSAQQSVVIGQDYHVYPAPLGDRALPRAFAPTRQPQAGARVEGDDYGGVRVWQPGESQRHIDWKAAARGQPLLTKQWMGEVEEILCFNWEDLGGLDIETRLSQLAKWIVLAERGTFAYELRLPGNTIDASRGDTHYHTCLRALAEFAEPS